MGISPTTLIALPHLQLTYEEALYSRLRPRSGRGVAQDVQNIGVVNRRASPAAHTGGGVIKLSTTWAPTGKS